MKKKKVLLPVKATDVKAAIKDADFVILSVWFSTIQDLLKEYPNEFQGKITIDPSNPIAPDGNGGYQGLSIPGF